MAFDPKASRAGLHYEKGSVRACRGLLEYLFFGQQVLKPAEVKTDKRGRRRLKNVIRRVSAQGGKQLDIFTTDGKVYQVYYSGTLVDWRLHGVPLLNRAVVKGWATRRGTMELLATL